MYSKLKSVVINYFMEIMEKVTTFSIIIDLSNHKNCEFIIEVRLTKADKSLLQFLKDLIKNW